MKKSLLIFTLSLLPLVTFAQTLSAQGLITSFLSFSNRVLIPFLLAIAFLIFVVNVIRFFVMQGAEDDGRENARHLALYSVLAFVVLIVFWGIINLLADSTTFSGKSAPTPDYLQKNDGALRNPVRGAGGTGDSPTNSPAAPAAPSGTPTTPGADTTTGAGTTDTRNDPINLLPPGIYDGGPTEIADPCSDGTGLNTEGNPCGIY